MTEERGGEEGAERLEARYANYFEVGHNAFEFVFDFGQLYAESSTPIMHTRVVTSPAYAQALSQTILESLGRYEQTFGSIPSANNDAGPS